jgi:DNA (cytosine-5)-methyltransferase 1
VTVPGVYYNEHKPFLCAWLRNLMRRGLIPDGEIDDRPIEAVRPDDVAGFRQCHFFAGIGGWAFALKLARCEDLECWTGSPPCQPFAVGGKRQGAADPRHLFPVWLDLIGERRPPILFGEQVTSLLGRQWLDRVRDDLGEPGYAFGAASLPACAVGAPHRRERLFFGAVADADGGGRRWRPCDEGLHHHREGAGWAQGQRELGRRGAAGGGAWDGAIWLDGPDGKRRRIGPGLQLLADGPAARSGRLRAYGNAIVPQVGAAFIAAFLEAIALADLSETNERGA